MSDKISIIITTKNDVENLLRCMLHLKLQEEFIYEVIIVDADGNDTIVNTCRANPFFFKYVDGYNTSLCEGRNRGLEAASGDIIAFIDSDTIVRMGWAVELQTAMKSHDVVAGYTIDGHGKHRMNRVSCFVLGNDITYAGCNIAYKRHVISKVGFFDTNLRSADDLDYNMRCVLAGFDIAYCPRMRLIHFHRQTTWKWMKQQFLYGYGRYQFNKKYRKQKHETGNFKNIFRLAFGAGGYLLGRFIYK